MEMEETELWLAMRETKYKKTMNNISAILNDKNADPIAMVEASFSEMVAAVHAETGTLWIYQKYGDGLVHPIAVYKGNLPKDFTIRPGEGIAGKSIKECKGFVIPDCQKDPRWAGKADAKSGFVTKSMICVPIITSEGGGGCIQIINKSDGLLFDDRDYDFLENLTNDVTRLFEERQITEILQMGRPVLNRISFDGVLDADTDEEARSILEQIDKYQDLSLREQRRVVKLINKLRKLIAEND